MTKKDREADLQLRCSSFSKQRKSDSLGGNTSSQTLCRLLVIHMQFIAYLEEPDLDVDYQFLKAPVRPKLDFFSFDLKKSNNSYRVRITQKGSIIGKGKERKVESDRGLRSHFVSFHIHVIIRRRTGRFEDKEREERKEFPLLKETEKVDHPFWKHRGHSVRNRLLSPND